MQASTKAHRLGRHRFFIKRLFTLGTVIH
jgi:hypothetical protein